MNLRLHVLIHPIHMLLKHSTIVNVNRCLVIFSLQLKQQNQDNGKMHIHKHIYVLYLILKDHIIYMVLDLVVKVKEVKEAAQKST